MKIIAFKIIVKLTLVFTVFVLPVKAQEVNKITSDPSISESDRGQRLPGTIFTWEKDKLPESQKIISHSETSLYNFQESAPLSFTGLAIGWEAEGSLPPAHHFELKIRSRIEGEQWPEWVSTTGYLNPDDSPSGLFWSMLYVTPDGSAHDEFEIQIISPSGSAITFVNITAADARTEQNKDLQNFKIESDDPVMPEVIAREGWWGDLPPDELEPDYTPQQIDITHAAVHHTVTANEPPDPPQVVRQIWDWHVNDNGWLDIGYNFLVDHNGSIYQGRYNPWLEDIDVRGAHAGNANSKSVGIALLGQFEPGANPQVGDPAANALDALIKMISWRFTQKDIDPLGEASIPVNPSGSQVLPTILGHRDVSPTACPGANLYTMLPEIRNSAEGGSGENGDDDDEVIAGPFRLYQNYPNPFRDETTIPFSLEQTRNIRIELYTVDGSRVRTLHEQRYERGEYEVPVSLNGLASGVYYYELVTRDFRQLRQMVYIR